MTAPATPACERDWRAVILEGARGSRVGFALLLAHRPRL
jgi:hypothetical protein